MIVVYKERRENKNLKTLSNNCLSRQKTKKDGERMPKEEMKELSQERLHEIAYLAILMSLKNLDVCIKRHEEVIGEIKSGQRDKGILKTLVGTDISLDEGKLFILCLAKDNIKKIKEEENK